MFEQLDFASFFSIDLVERDTFCRKLVSNLQEYGFVKLKNHGVVPSAIDKAFETVCIVRKPLQQYITEATVLMTKRIVGNFSTCLLSRK